MRKFKSTISILLAVIMLFSTLPLAVGAADTSSSGQCGDNVYWTLDEEGTLTISGEGYMWGYESGSSPFYENKTIKNVKIENGIASIGDFMFEFCYGLMGVTIPDSVTIIGACAFAGCLNLTNVETLDGVEIICENAFYMCVSLMSISMSDVFFIDDCAFFMCENLRNVEIGECASSIGEGAFLHCNSLKEITVPKSVKEIGTYALGYDCLDDKGNVFFLSDVIDSIIDGSCELCADIENKIKNEDFTINGYVGTEANTYATGNGFKFVDVEKSKPTITSGKCGDNAFWTLDEEGTLTINGEGETYSYRLDYDDGSPFYKNPYIKNIVIDSGITGLGNYVFEKCSNLMSVAIPDSVKNIGEGVFSNCYNLKNVTIPDGVIIISSSVFSGCHRLERIIIPNSVTNIGEEAFDGCWSLKNLVIPDSMISIGGNAFYSCESLTKIIIPDSVTYVGGEAFVGCKNLESVTLSKNLEEICEGAFLCCTSLKEITIPNSYVQIGPFAFGYDDYTDPIKIDDFIINGLTNSTAHKYAIENGFEFNSIGSEHIHSYVSSVTTSPTCTEDGVRTYTCSCGDSYTEKISATGHETEHVEIPSTCTVCGVSYDVCTKCSETFNYTVLPLAEHTFGEYTITKQPTYTQEGEREASCSICGFKITETIEKLVPSNTSKDEQTGISVGYNDDAFEEDIVLSVTEVLDGVSFNVLNNEKGNFKNELFDIVIKSGDENVQPNTSVLVSIPLPDGYNPEKTVVYYVTNDGRLEKLNSHYENGYIVFEASHFSHYAIVDEGSNISNPTDNCTCLCHKTGFVGFIYKIVRLFWKLFKINKTCSCGAVHY